jgi:hypothetical protein
VVASLLTTLLTRIIVSRVVTVSWNAESALWKCLTWSGKGALTATTSKK